MSFWLSSTATATSVTTGAMPRTFGTLCRISKPASQARASARCRALLRGWVRRVPPRAGRRAGDELVRRHTQVGAMR
jgi:hypothetical protein